MDLMQLLLNYLVHNNDSCLEIMYIEVCIKMYGLKLVYTFRISPWEEKRVALPEAPVKLVIEGS